MKLYAISDLHLGFPDNRRALGEISPHPDDWLILGGDIGETERHLAFAIHTLKSRFAKLIWVPGNHELWTLPRMDMPRGVEKYQRMVDLCRRHGVLTPEDPFVLWPGDGGTHLIAPLFLLYDYTFRPDDIPVDEAVQWARQAGIECADEHLLHPDPHPSRSAWCEERCRITAARLTAALEVHDGPTVLVNHFPLRQELARLPAIPRFSIWCGTRLTHDWHVRFRAAAVVFGHLHIRQSRLIDGVRFEEVSLGYPRQRAAGRSIDSYLRVILPASAA